MRGGSHAVLWLLALTAACDPGPPNEIVVFVSSSLAVEGEAPPPACASWAECAPIGMVTLQVLLPERVSREGFTARFGDDSEEGALYEDAQRSPVSWGLVSPDDPDQRVEIIARGYEHSPYGEDPIIEQRARVQFLPATVDSLLLDLHPNCVGAVCGDDETCLAHTTGAEYECVSVCLSELPDYDGEAPRPDEIGWRVPPADCEPLE